MLHGLGGQFFQIFYISMGFFNGFSIHIIKWVQSICHKNVYEMMLFRIGGYFIHLTVGV